MINTRTISNVWTARHLAFPGGISLTSSKPDSEPQSLTFVVWRVQGEGVIGEKNKVLNLKHFGSGLFHKSMAWEKRKRKRENESLVD